MENNNIEQVTFSKKRKFLLELKDLFSGIVFPFMISLVFSLSIILFSTDRGVDFGVRLLSLIGGEALLVAAFIVFGRANGVAAYDKTILYDPLR